MSKTYFDITIIDPRKGDVDITEDYLFQPSIDGSRPDALGRGLPGLRALTEDEAKVVANQIIDEAREWGPTDLLAEALYDYAESTVEKIGKGETEVGKIATVDGPVIEVRRGIPRWDGESPRYTVGWHSSDPSHCHVALHEAGEKSETADNVFDVALYSGGGGEDDPARVESLNALNTLVAKANAAETIGYMLSTPEWSASMLEDAAAILSQAGVETDWPDVDWPRH